MTKKLPLYLLVLLLVVATCVGAYFYLNNKRPPIETKFVQNAKKPNEPASTGTNSNEQSSTMIKEPGNYALVDNPNHTYQTFNNCGPATLSMILSFYGKNVSQKELGDLMRPYQIASGDNDDKTIFTREFVSWAKKYNVEAIGRVNGDISLLKKFTANGIPVVVKTWLHVGEDIGHFRVVRGFDEEQKVIIQDDSYEGPNRKIPYFDFLSMWQPFNYDYVIVYRPDQREIVESILGAELDENVAWQNSLNRALEEEKLDANNVYPKFNQASAYYRLGDFQNTIDVFESVENRLPKRMMWYQIEPLLAYYKLSQYERVISLADKILENGNKANAELYYIKSKVYETQGKTDLAKLEYEKIKVYNKNLSEEDLHLITL